MSCIPQSSPCVGQVHRALPEPLHCLALPLSLGCLRAQRWHGLCQSSAVFPLSALGSDSSAGNCEEG